MVLEGIVSKGIDLVLIYGFIGIFVFAFLETSMLFPYLPAEVVVPLAALALVDSPISIGIFTAVATLGGTLGALVAYSVSLKGGRLAQTRFESYIRLSDVKRERADHWYSKWGEQSVLWGRYLPGLRSVVSIPAGIAGMESLRFTLLTTIGNAGFYSSVAVVVYSTEITSLRSIGNTLVEGSTGYIPGLAVILSLTIISWKVSEHYLA